jgi:hypothetical protein
MLEGSLQPILTAFEPESTPVNLLHVERRGASGKVRTFVEFVTETLRRNVHLQHPDMTPAGDGTASASAAPAAPATTRCKAAKRARKQAGVSRP